jgi:hypothetical protein
MKALTSARQKFITVAMVAILVLVALFALFLVVRNPEPRPMRILSELVIDVDDPQAVAGLVDHVFIGRVEGEGKVDYYNVAVRETEQGPKTDGTPFMNYKITVLKNLKGKLPLQTLPMQKKGGVTMDGKYLYLGEGDFLPEKGDICVFYASVQEDGSLWIPGKNFSVKIVDTKDFGKTSAGTQTAQLETARQEILQAAENSPVYQRLAAAVENEKVYERERFTVTVPDAKAVLDTEEVTAITDETATADKVTEPPVRVVVLY